MNSAKPLLSSLQHGVNGSPASWSGTCTCCCLPPLLSPVGRTEERKGRKRLWSLLNCADGLCHVRGALTWRDVPKHSSLCLIKRKNYRAAWVSTSIILWWRRKSPYQSKLSASEQQIHYVPGAAGCTGDTPPGATWKPCVSSTEQGGGPPCHHPIPQTCSYSSLCSQFCLL